MNCQPDDLARVIDHPESRLQGIVDRFVTVTTGFQLPSEGKLHHIWYIERPMRCACGCGGMIVAICDSLLRPIRDPGADAKDEMLRPLPSEVTA